MLKPLLEPLAGPDTYPLHSDLVANATKELRDSGALDLNLPYGEGTNTFAAGFIGKFANDGGSTVFELADADGAFVIFASNFIDSLRSGNCDAYYLGQFGKYRVKGCYDTGMTYAVNTLLTWIPTGTNQGMLTPAASYANQRIIAMVIEPPTNAANDDEMSIVTGFQWEAAAGTPGM